MRLLLRTLSRTRTSRLAGRFQSGANISHGFPDRQPIRCLSVGRVEAHVSVQESIERRGITESRILRAAILRCCSLSTPSCARDSASDVTRVDPSPTFIYRTLPARVSIQRRLETRHRNISQDFLRTFSTRATNSLPGGKPAGAPRVTPGDLQEEDEFTAESLEKLGQTAQESFGSDHEFTATLNLKLAQAYLKEGHSDEKALEAALKAWKVK